MLLRALSLAALALAACAVDCPVCPTTDLAGDALVAQSGGTRGTPLFCGYSADATGAAGPQVECFYSTSGVGFGEAGCPTTAVVEDAC
ncbi:hypothetical protein B0H10DRAFT_2007195 [Mycena sp. CBHHK59/15]|nr:hypothetical protein B0H10DRAFT_2007195 [Mycena sp. CBHHK59/15]